MRPKYRMGCVAGMLASMLLFTPPLSARTPKVGTAAPSFTLRTLDGRTIALGDLRGQVVVLNFWATWCVPCRTELPTLDAYYRIQKSHGLAMFAVTTEDSVPLSRMKALTDQLAIPAVKGIRGPYGPLSGVPTNYIIDRAGVLRYAQAGAFDLDALNSLLVPLLKEPTPVEQAVASAAH